MSARKQLFVGMSTQCSQRSRSCNGQTLCSLTGRTSGFSNFNYPRNRSAASSISPRLVSTHSPKPDTILGWYRKLVAQKFDGSRKRTYPGRHRVSLDVEELIVRFAKENSGWGYDRIVGALANLCHCVSDQTVGNILERHGLGPALKRSQTIRWKDFIA
jgi:hypothetical protein